MRYRDIPLWSGGETPDQVIAVAPSTEMYLFAVLPRQRAQSQDRAATAGGRLVAAACAADARLVAAETKFMQATDHNSKRGVTHSSVFQDEKLYRVEQVDTRPVDAPRGLIASEFDEQAQSFLSVPKCNR